MENFSIISKISLIGAILFAYLWYRTSLDRRYETVEMERVFTKRVFLVIAVVSFGFFLAPLFLWT